MQPISTHQATHCTSNSSRAHSKRWHVQEHPTTSVPLPHQSPSRPAQLPSWAAKQHIASDRPNSRTCLCAQRNVVWYTHLHASTFVATHHFQQVPWGIRLVPVADVTDCSCFLPTSSKYHDKFLYVYVLAHWCVQGYHKKHTLCYLTPSLAFTPSSSDLTWHNQFAPRTV